MRKSEVIVVINLIMFVMCICKFQVLLINMREDGKGQRCRLRKFDVYGLSVEE